MKVCYLDESGTGQEPVAVVAGVIVDSQRMHITKEHWADLLDHLSGICGKRLQELHTKDFYAGSGPFRNLPGHERAEYISSIVSWLCERKHDLVYSAVHKGQFQDSKAKAALQPEIETPWRMAAFHCILAIQRAHQSVEKNKGHTLLVFDDKGHDEAPLATMVLTPPVWSDSYYSRGKKQAALDHIIDAPYFADSKQVPMLQVADFLAYFFRRYVEIAENLVPPKYPEEEQRIREWVGTLSKRCVGYQHMYPAKGRCPTAEMFYAHCPPSLRRVEG
jgi:hypothetical protein